VSFAALALDGNVHFPLLIVPNVVPKVGLAVQYRTSATDGGLFVSLGTIATGTDVPPVSVVPLATRNQLFDTDADWTPANLTRVNRHLLPDITALELETENVKTSVGDEAAGDHCVYEAASYVFLGPEAMPFWSYTEIFNDFDTAVVSASYPDNAP
jgi:hypothetical protein